MKIKPSPLDRLFSRYIRFVRDSQMWWLEQELEGCQTPKLAS